MKTSNKDIDLSLVKRAKAGDLRAYDLLVLKYQARLISTAYKFVKDRHIAEDIAQESFIKSFKSLSAFREDSTFYTWIYRITVNTAILLRLIEKKLKINF
jgi:RNA polymerase sigma-70 factor (ECF subfamily)